MTWTDLRQGVLEAFVDAAERGDALNFFHLPAGVEIVNDEFYHVTTRRACTDFEDRIMQASSARVVWNSREIAKAIGSESHSDVCAAGQVLARAGWRSSNNTGKRYYINEPAIVAWAAQHATCSINAAALASLPGATPGVAAHALRRAGFTRHREQRRNFWRRPKQRRALAKTADA